jgi:hypothetical protein
VEKESRKECLIVDTICDYSPVQCVDSASVGRNFDRDEADQHPDKICRPAADFFPDIASLRGHINWDIDPEALAVGDLSGRATWLVDALLRISSENAVEELARSLGKTALAIAVALVAELDSTRSRTAARIARGVLKGADKEMLRAARLATKSPVV